MTEKQLQELIQGESQALVAVFVVEDGEIKLTCVAKNFPTEDLLPAAEHFLKSMRSEYENVSGSKKSIASASTGARTGGKRSAETSRSTGRSRSRSDTRR